MPQTDSGQKQKDDRQAEEMRRRSAGEGFDERMKEFIRDEPRPPRADPERRRRR